MIKGLNDELNHYKYLVLDLKKKLYKSETNNMQLKTNIKDLYDTITINDES